MPIILLVTFHIRAEAAGLFEELIAGLAHEVRASEPGVTHYQLARSKDDPLVYHMWEVYADQAAFDAHGKTEHMRAARPKFADCMAGPPVFQFLEPAVG